MMGRQRRAPRVVTEAAPALCNSSGRWPTAKILNHHLVRWQLDALYLLQLLLFQLMSPGSYPVDTEPANG